MQTPTAAGTYALTKVEITTFTETNEYGPIPDNTICGPVYVKEDGPKDPIVKWNGYTLPPP